jgi:hypothetical protein
VGLFLTYVVLFLLIQSVMYLHDILSFKIKP